MKVSVSVVLAAEAKGCIRPEGWKRLRASLSL